jgi:predicted Zn finger-like uncharacterized protein
MILTCPRCSARYAVGAAKIPTGGRTVRCVACAHKWTARRGDGEPEPWEEVPPPLAAPKNPEAPPILIPEPEPSPPDAFEDLEPMIPPPVSDRKGKGKGKGKSGLSSRLVWAGLAAVLALIAVGVALFRNPIVRLWPKTAALYAAAGVSVNGVGLVIEQVRLSPAVQNGQAILGVSGRIRNERDKPTPAAPLQVTLLDARGAILSTLVSKPVDTLPPLQSRYFQVLVRNPPPGVASVALTFVSHPPATGKATGAAHAPGPAHGSAPAGEAHPPPHPAEAPPPAGAPPAHE